MKKNIFSWLTIALMAIVCVGFSACGSDGDDDGGNGGGGSTSDLVGTWKRVYKLETKYQKNSSGQWEQVGQEEKTYDNVSAHGFLFNADKTAKSIYISPDGTITPESRDDFEYKVQNGQLYMLELDESDTDGWESWGYIQISGNEFVLTEEDIDGTRREVDIKHYRKIK